MIQRIQSVYLALAAIALIVLFFLPVSSFLSEISYDKLYITHLKSLTPGAEVLVPATKILPLAVLNVINIIVIIISIFMYKKRLFQSRMVKLSILLNIILLGLIFFIYSDLVGLTVGSDAEYSDSMGLYAILFSILMLVMANRGILRDEKLVRSADRLR